MDCGFETIGNATLICHDKRPVLVTDPWLADDAYFGSWSLSHEIPPEQEVRVTRLVGIYTSLNLIIEYADGNGWQPVAMTFEAEVIGGQLRLSDETTDYACISVDCLNEVDLM